MNREKLIRDLRKYARRNDLHFSVSKKKGKGSHYAVEVGTATTIMQSDLDTYEMMRCLKQLKINPAAL